MSLAFAIVQEPFIPLVPGNRIMEADLPLGTLESDGLLPYIPKSIKILGSLLMRCELLIRFHERRSVGMVLPHSLCNLIEWAHGHNKCSQAVCRSAHGSVGSGGGGKLQGLHILYAQVVIQWQSHVYQVINLEHLHP